MIILEKIFSNKFISTILFIVGGIIALGLNLKDFYCSSKEKCEGDIMKIIIIIEILCGYLMWAFLAFLFYSLGKFNKQIEEQRIQDSFGEFTKEKISFSKLIKFLSLGIIIILLMNLKSMLCYNDEFCDRAKYSISRSIMFTSTFILIIFEIMAFIYIQKINFVLKGQPMDII